LDQARVAEWVVGRLAQDVPTLVGIDHGFSFPLRYFEAHCRIGIERDCRSACEGSLHESVPRPRGAWPLICESRQLANETGDTYKTNEWLHNVLATTVISSVQQSSMQTDTTWKTLSWIMNTLLYKSACFSLKMTPEAVEPGAIGVVIEVEQSPHLTGPSPRVRIRIGDYESDWVFSGGLVFLNWAELNVPQVTGRFYSRAMAARIRTDGFVDPCIPSRAAKAPQGPGWVHEIKHDGYRPIVRRDGATVRLFTRRGYDWTDRYPAIATAAGKPRAKSFTMDGEAVVLGSMVLPYSVRSPGKCLTRSSTR
jgi:ATP dependent DNA ligase domain